MSEEETPRYSPEWLGSRERADADARSVELLEPLRRHLAGVDRPVIRDLGCGTGSMGRWLARQLPGPQHWIMHDHDPELLAHASANMVGTAADGAPVTVETQQGDVTRLTAGELTGATLVTASALLDLFTLDEVTGLAAACVGAGCPALLTLSVVGRVEFTPANPLDADLTAAFNAHQRRESGGRRLLGPDAADATAEAFTALGATVLVRPSPWRLGPTQAGLTEHWLRGWVAAACEERPELTEPAAGYLAERIAAIRSGELQAVVEHEDLLAGYE